nr:flavodoxin family protein [Megasphaera elsdenii]
MTWKRQAQRRRRLYRWPCPWNPCAWKRKDKKHGTCIVKDDLAPVLERVKAADAVIFGSPIYFMNLTAQMQAFLERFFFSQYIYSREIPSVLGKKMPSAFLYTMNATEEQMEQFHLKESLATYEWAAASKKACPACFFLFMRFPSFPSIVLHSPDFFQSVKKTRDIASATSLGQTCSLRFDGADFDFVDFSLFDFKDQTHAGQTLRPVDGFIPTDHVRLSVGPLQEGSVHSHVDSFRSCPAVVGRHFHMIDGSFRQMDGDPIPIFVFHHRSRWMGSRIFPFCFCWSTVYLPDIGALTANSDAAQVQGFLRYRCQCGRSSQRQKCGETHNCPFFH